MSAPAPAPPAPSGHLALVVAIAAGIAALRVAALAIGDLPLYLDEAQYWFWAQDLAFGYFSKPPLIAWAIAGTTAICGDGAACVKLASPLAYALAPIFAYLLGRNLFSDRVGLLSAIGFATLPGVAFSGFIISTDPLLLLFWVMGLWAYERGLATGSRPYWLALGVALGLGLLAKYAMAYFALPALIVMALRPKGLRSWGGLALAGLVGLAILSPNLIWNAQSGFETFRHTAANASVGARIGNVAGVVDFLADQAAILGGFSLILIAVLIRPRASFAGRGERFLGWFSLPILALLIVQAFLSRAHGNWAAVAFPALVVLIVAVLDRLDWPRLLKATLAFHAVILLVLTAGIAIGQVPFVELTTKTDPFRWVRGWDRLAGAVDGLRRQGADRVVITTERGATAELVYWLRDSGAVIRRWSNAADGAPDDSFALVLDINDARGRDAVIVSRSDNLSAELIAAFAAVEAPVKVEMRPYPDPKGTYYLFVGHQFRGRETP
ncbi:phospholipid carrier-dependent glycosyltransferase [Oleomonas cavernae]|uniref:Phospholipid carrier-dependent glycosyltransferase n=1 Tax=Oleomonas cavernae TaxID=2320859 RepID=A0A418WAA3_9PROT|nr:glycosyltransferase family 39 protein [Oleomonas cavernae]RJF86919.1 phospholipid carrier-dependent glycosyltransferase [Oleomonas cavernae]